MSFFLLFLFLLCYASAEPEKDDWLFKELVEWMKSEGAHVDDRITVTMTSYGVRGMLATDHMKKGTKLITFNDNVVLKTQDGPCSWVDLVKKELELGSDSYWWPYLRLDDSLNAQIPGLWNQTVVAKELQGLPPTDFHRHTNWYMKNCASGEFENLPLAEKQAFLMYTTRGSQKGFLPVYDLANHNNGKINAKAKLSNGKIALELTHDIAPGEEIHVEYGHSSTSDIFRDYGFVEPFPRVFQLLVNEKVYDLALLSEDGPLVVNGGSQYDDNWYPVFYLSPTLDLEKEKATKDLLSRPQKELLQLHQAAQRLLTELPTSVEEDEVLVKDAEGERKLLIDYRIQYKLALRRVDQILEQIIGTAKDL